MVVIVGMKVLSWVTYVPALRVCGFAKRNTSRDGVPLEYHEGEREKYLILVTES